MRGAFLFLATVGSRFPDDVKRIIWDLVCNSTFPWLKCSDCSVPLLMTTGRGVLTLAAQKPYKVVGDRAICFSCADPQHEDGRAAILRDGQQDRLCIENMRS